LDKTGPWHDRKKYFIMNLMSRFLLSCFPLPDYLRMPAVGIDVSDRSIKYVELKRGKDGLELKSFGKGDLEKGIVEKGETKKKEALIKKLSIVRKKLRNSLVAVSLPEEKAFLKVVKLPFVKDSQIRKVLEVQLEEIIPLSVKDMVFDFDVIKRSSSSSGGLEVLVCAFPSGIVEDYVEVFTRADLLPIVFEIEGQSIFRVLVKPDEEKATMIVDFGKTRTTFLIGEAGFVKFTSTIGVAGEHIDKVLAKSLDTGLLSAERIKKEQIVQLGQIDNSEGLDSILPVISVLKDETKRVLDYWQSHAKEQGFRNEKVSEIILCGGDSNLIGLADYLSDGLKKPVKLGNAWLNISSLEDYIPEIDHRASLKYVTALGLSLRSFNY